MKLFVLINPITTEKSSQAQEKGIYTFLVRKDATKIDVKQTFEQLYGEKVKSVKIIYIKPKKRTAGRGITIEKRPRLKKAIIRLKGKKKVDLYKFEK